MQDSPPFFLIVMALAGVLGVVAVVAGLRLHPGRPSRGIAVLAVLPALGMLGVFYSLAIHMHQSLGSWPDSIGTRGFPPALRAHAEMAFQYFSILLLCGMFAWPVGFVLSALVRPWRGALFHLGVFALSWGVCLAAMLLAPSRFLYWWWD